MPSSHDIVPDGPMTPQQQTVANSLNEDMVAKIDAALLSHARTKNRKGDACRLDDGWYGALCARTP